MDGMLQNKYTVESVVKKLEKLSKADIPEEYRRWAGDGVAFAAKYSDVDVQDFPNNIFFYLKNKPMPEEVRELVEGILLQGIEICNDAAAFNLGALYECGMLGEQSYDRAFELYETAAEAGNEKAYESLGDCFYAGRGCEADCEKAFLYYARGAFSGRVYSLIKISDMYGNGQYVERDETEAARIIDRCLDLIEKDADLADEFGADVHIRKAECLFYGFGGETDELKALFWAHKAEIEYRRMEKKSVPQARKGVNRSVTLINECRRELDRKYGPDARSMAN